MTEQKQMSPDNDFLRQIRPARAKPLANFAGVGIVLFAPGFGLGLGDQCMCVPLVEGIRRKFPNARVTLLTDWPQFWTLKPMPNTRVCGYAREYEAAVMREIGRHELSILGYFPGMLNSFEKCASPIVFACGERLTEFRCFHATNGHVFEVPLTECRSALRESSKFAGLFNDLGVPVRDAQRPLAQAPRHTGPHRVLIHPCAAKPYKEWPVARWQELAIDIVESGGNVVLSPGNSAREFQCAERIAAVDTRISVQPQLPLTAFIQEFAEYDLVISGDTALTHLVAHTGLSHSLGIFGPTDPLRFCPASPNCFFIAPFETSRANVFTATRFALAFARGDVGALLGDEYFDRVKDVSVRLCEKVAEALLTEDDRMEATLALAIREFHSVVAPDHRHFLCGAPEQFTRTLFAVRNLPHQQALERLRQSAVYRSASAVARLGCQNRP